MSCDDTLYILITCNNFTHLNQKGLNVLKLVIYLYDLKIFLTYWIKFSLKNMMVCVLLIYPSTCDCIR